MALRILIADPDDQWSEQVANFLKENLYQVDVVNNGRNAQLNLYNNKYFAVVLNMSLQNHSGSQVLMYINANVKYQRTIVILDNAEWLKDGSVSESALQNKGATEVVCKPLTPEQLGEVIEGHESLGDLVSKIKKREGVSEEEEVNASDEDFSKVKISEFYSSKAVLFDVYVKLDSGRYVKILHSGDTFSKERIDKYKNEKGVEFLYFHQRDRRKYIQYTNFLAQKLIDNKQVSTAMKVNMMKSVSEKFVEEAFTKGCKPQVIEQAKEVTDNIYKVIEESEDLWSLMRTLDEFDPDAFTHAFLVTLYSSAIIKQFDWQSKLTIETTAMACMFHDIGKIALPKELIGLRPEQMSEEQLEKYKEHPRLGVEIVEKNKSINVAVKQIILQHHERFDGSGFPHGLKREKIQTLANIVGLADDFVHLITAEKIPPVAGLKKLLGNQELAGRYNSVILENFIKVFTDPGKIKTEDNVPQNSKVVKSG